MKIKIQLMCGEEIAMGPGKADLMDAIREHGSITSASRAMGMSYRRAWLLVDTMNRCWSQPLVQAFPGRARGSGAQLTEMGETVLMSYRSMQVRAEQACGQVDGDRLAAMLRPQPLPYQLKTPSAPDT